MVQTDGVSDVSVTDSNGIATLRVSRVSVSTVTLTVVGAEMTTSCGCTTSRSTALETPDVRVTASAGEAVEVVWLCVAEMLQASPPIS